MLFIVAMAMPNYAQTSTTMTGSGDSVVGTGTKYLTANLDGNCVAATVEVVFTKSKNTTRGTLTLQVSQDGTNWYSVTTGTSHTVGAVTYVDTLTNTTTQRKIFVVPDPQNFKYVRLMDVGAGNSTNSHRLSGTIYKRKE